MYVILDSMDLKRYQRTITWDIFGWRLMRLTFTTLALVFVLEEQNGTNQFPDKIYLNRLIEKF